MSDALLVCVTETAKRDAIDGLVSALAGMNNFQMDKPESRIKKATTHVPRTKGSCSKSPAPGASAIRSPRSTCPSATRTELIAKELAQDDDLEGMPELSEVDVIRHFTRISTWNYGVDTGMYPLGSCTMKYNPRINERVARIEGFAALHPLTPAPLAQGALEIIRRLEECLAQITGLAAVTRNRRRARRAS